MLALVSSNFYLLLVAILPLVEFLLGADGTVCVFPPSHCAKPHTYGGYFLETWACGYGATAVDNPTFLHRRDKKLCISRVISIHYCSCFLYCAL